MRVTFTKQAGRRYLVGIEREHGPVLQPRHGPGYDELMPHDIAHYVVEEQLGIRLGVFGQLAAGGAGLFAPAPADRRGGDRRAGRRFATAGRDDMRRSEAAVGRCVAEWQRRTGAAAGPVADVDAGLTESDVERVVSRLEEVSRDWRALAPGAALTFAWPRTLTLNPAGSVQGRRRPRTPPPQLTRPRPPRPTPARAQVRWLAHKLEPVRGLDNLCASEVGASGWRRGRRRCRAPR